MKKHAPFIEPEFRVLRYLQAVSDEGSFGNAALELGMSPSNIKRQINRLERKAGPLLQRFQNQIVPTHAGRLLLDRLPALFDRLRNLEKIADALRHRGATRLGFAISYLALLDRRPLLAIERLEQSLDLDVRFQTGSHRECLEAVKSCRCDLAIVFEEPACPSREGVQLGTSRCGFFVPPERLGSGARTSGSRSTGKRSQVPPSQDLCPALHDEAESETGGHAFGDPGDIAGLCRGGSTVGPLPELDEETRLNLGLRDIAFVPTTPKKEVELWVRGRSRPPEEAVSRALKLMSSDGS